MRNIKILFYAYQLYKYVVFYPLLALSTVFLGTLASLMAIVFGAKIATWNGVIWARFNSLITPMFVKVIGREKINKKQSYVVVANHQSQYDIFVIYGWLPLDFRWVMKMELRKVPILGYYCYKAGHIYIDRSDSKAAIDSINAAKSKMKNGTSVVFFPEGTRSVTGQLLEFKKGAFKFALDLGLPVLPITIIGTKEILPANSIGLFPGNAKLVIHKPIDIAGYTEKNIQELMDRAKESIQQGLDEHSGRSADA